MDVIKVRLQLQNQLAKASLGHLHSSSPYHGFLHAGKKIYLEEGYFRGLMKGYICTLYCVYRIRQYIPVQTEHLCNCVTYTRFTPSMMREFTYSSLRMGLYDPVKQMVSGNK